MNKTFLIAFLFVCFFTFADTAHASTLGAPPNNLGLVGYWTMDGKDINWATGRITDRSGNGNPGLLSGMSTSTSPVLGKIGQAISFNGSTQGVIVANSSPLTIETGDAAWSAWIYPLNAGDSVDFEQVILDKEQGGGGFGGIYMFLKANHLCIYNGSASCGSLTIQNGKWYHVVIIKSGTTATPYVNGVADTPISWSGGGQPQNLGIGIDSATGGRFFTGSIDEVRVYNRALSASEVTKLYNAGGAKQSASLSTLIPNGLITYWSLNNKEINWTTGRATDISGSGNTGLMISLSTTTSPAMGKIGQGLSFDGSTQYIVGAQTVNTGLVTMSIWFKKSGKPASQAWIAGFQNGLSGGSWDKDFYLTTSGTVTWYLFDGSSKDVAGTTVVTDGKWHHIVGIADGTNGVLYIDGVQDATFPVGSTYAGYTVPNIFVGGTNLSGIALSQTVDEFRVYNRALSVTEIKQLYNAGVGSKSGVVPANKFASGGLVGYWSMNGKDLNWLTGRATDTSGSGNNGVLGNFSTTTSPVMGKIGQGLRFNGSNTFFATPDLSTYLNNANPFTVSVWFKANAAGVILDETDTNTGGASTGWHDSWIEIASDGAVKGRVWACATVALGTVTFGTWNHVVMTYTAGSLGGAVNGIAATPGSCTRTLPGSPIYYILGIADSTNVAGGAAFSGAMDEFRIYTRVLSTSEIKSLYNQGR